MDGPDCGWHTAAHICTACGHLLPRLAYLTRTCTKTCQDLVTIPCCSGCARSPEQWCNRPKLPRSPLPAMRFDGLLAPPLATVGRPLICICL